MPTIRRTTVAAKLRLAARHGEQIQEQLEREDARAIADPPHTLAYEEQPLDAVLTAANVLTDALAAPRWRSMRTGVLRELSAADRREALDLVATARRRLNLLEERLRRPEVRATRRTA